MNNRRGTPMVQMVVIGYHPTHNPKQSIQRTFSSAFCCWSCRDSFSIFSLWMASSRLATWQTHVRIGFRVTTRKAQHHGTEQSRLVSKCRSRGCWGERRERECLCFSFRALLLARPLAPVPLCPEEKRRACAQPRTDKELDTRSHLFRKHVMLTLAGDLVRLNLGFQPSFLKPQTENPSCQRTLISFG